MFLSVCLSVYVRSTLILYSKMGKISMLSPEKKALIKTVDIVVLKRELFKG